MGTGFYFTCCCDISIGQWDFYGLTTQVSTEAAAGRTLVRVASSILLGDDAGSAPDWVVDIADFNGPSGNVDVWITRRTTDPASEKDQRIWYYLSKGTSSGDYRIEVVDYDFNGTPTNSATYTVDWDGSFDGPNPDSSHQFVDVTWDSILRRMPNDTDVGVGYSEATNNIDPTSYADEIDLSDLSELKWNEYIVAATTSLANQYTCSVDRQTYFSGDYRPLAAARCRADKGVGFRRTITVSDTTWKYHASGYWYIIDAPELTAWEFKVVIGDMTIADENSSVADDTVVYTLTGKTLVSLADEGDTSGAGDKKSIYEVEGVCCHCLEIVGDSPVGIFFFADDCEVSVRGREAFPGTPSPDDEFTGTSYLEDCGTSGGPITVPQPGTVSRVDILLPNHTVESTGITSLTSGDIPRMVRHALSSSGGGNGKFFMVTQTNNYTGDTGHKLKYMSDATTAVWTKTFNSIYIYFEVTDRFVYVIADKGGGDGLLSYAYDYAGNEYELQFPYSPYRPLPPYGTTPGEPTYDFYYLEAWAACRYADAIFPDADFLTSQAS